ncbi:hypothetical protein GOODEAATRI_028414 [Goodea atripinnis]|uniref:Uncharacterized protein n=1 Tax=Goodea atripinnis TaxID=208336 RepID=A0ABV0MMR1_9TELE
MRREELQNEGSQFSPELPGVNGCSGRRQTQPLVSGTKGAGNLLTTSGFFSGIHFAKFERFCTNISLKTEDIYFKLRKRFVFPVIERTCLKEQRAVVTPCRSKKMELSSVEMAGVTLQATQPNTANTRF